MRTEHVIPSERSESRDLHLWVSRGDADNGRAHRELLRSVPARREFHAETAEQCAKAATNAVARGGRGARRSDLSAGPLKPFGVVDGEEPCAGARSPTRKAVLCVLRALCEKNA